ncbi:hypothetical protein CPB84DRAFT_1849449 [Gymnopilus junonius]|uniref:Uncharacterized protein n=1 Tax=Gymnopilus junonius TaxID=109634 RepID=A0A9P5NJN5_GYMJU|nr:hypothetical protein CPB84DRAFT_1849449 [Gymnopilus junonius]
MWCDNCLLLFPLRGGAMAWSAVIALYSIAGAIFLFKDGDIFFFVYPEWQIYGEISMAIGACAVISMMALSNRSYIWTRVSKFLWPFIIVIAAIRAIIIIVELLRGKDDITWECDNGGQLWSSTNSTMDASTAGTVPSSFCTPGFTSLLTAFIIALLVDIAFQIYMFFMMWRFEKRLEHYSHMKGPFNGGYYN